MYTVTNTTSPGYGYLGLFDMSGRGILYLSEIELVIVTSIVNSYEYRTHLVLNSIVNEDCNEGYVSKDIYVL